MALELQGLVKQYPDIVAVNHVSLALTSGIWGLLGANGAGKTTLMRMAAGILTPTKGKVMFNGSDIAALGASYRDMLGYLPQSFGYHPGFTVKGYLEYMCAVKGIPKAKAKTRIEELLGRFQLEKSGGKLIRKLSGGMQRRVGMAQALLNDPDVLILDEPTSGLDPGERIRLRHILAEYARQRIVLISTHIVSDVESIANRIALMKHGEILAAGAPEELVRGVEGKVWEATCPGDQLAAHGDAIRIVNMRSEGAGVAHVHYVADDAVLPGSQPVAPSLEDLYLWIFREEPDRREEL